MSQTLFSLEVVVDERGHEQLVLDYDCPREIMVQALLGIEGVTSLVDGVKPSTLTLNIEGDIVLIGAEVLRKVGAHWRGPNGSQDN